MEYLLRKYFPMIRTREEVLEVVRESEKLTGLFESWSEEQQKLFLDFCCGIRGVKLLYDAFFKEVFSPELHRDRLEAFLSCLLRKKIRIQQVLPNDTVRLAEEWTLLITDIVIELEDGTIGNLEIQKIGYAFPGQRAACYSADLLLRQYKRVKDRRKKNFTYRDLKKVYTIVLFERSTREFHKLPEVYVHRAKQVFDTGLEMELLQEYVLVSLDIFQRFMHNKPIESQLDAWLMFLSTENPERIAEIIEKYPRFQEMYEDVYQLCRNVEGIMELFSKELLEMDRNTVQYMIEELEEELKEEKKKAEAERQKAKQEAMEKDAEIARLKGKLRMLQGENL